MLNTLQKTSALFQQKNNDNSQWCFHKQSFCLFKTWDFVICACETSWRTLTRLVPCHCFGKGTAGKSLLKKNHQKEFMLFENKLLHTSGNIQRDECTLFPAAFVWRGNISKKQLFILPGSKTQERTGWEDGIKHCAVYREQSVHTKLKSTLSGRYALKTLLQ